MATILIPIYKYTVCMYTAFLSHPIVNASIAAAASAVMTSLADWEKVGKHSSSCSCSDQWRSQR